MTTIVMPVYNTSQRYLAAALETALLQRLPILLIDDGSTEQRTIEYLKQFSTQYRSICTLIRNRNNRGLSAVMNQALWAVKTPYILKLDADDILFPEAAEKLHEGLKRWPDASAIGVQLQAFGGLTLITDHPEEVTAKWVISEQPNWIMNHTGCLLKVADLLEIGGYREDRAGLPEDYELWVNLLIAGKKLYNLPEVLLQYRVTAGNLSNRMDKTRRENFIHTQRDKLKCSLSSR